MMLTQQIIDKLIRWQEQGNEMSVTYFPEDQFDFKGIVNVKNAMHLRADMMADYVILTLRNSYNSWSVTVEQQSDFDRDLTWLFAESVGRFIAEQARGKERGVA